MPSSEFDSCTQLFHYHCNQDMEHLCHHKELPQAPLWSVPFLHLWPLATIVICFLSLVFPFLGFHINNVLQCVVRRLRFIHVVGHSSYLLLSITHLIRWNTVYFFIPQLINIWLVSGLWLLLKTAMDLWAQMFMWTYIFILRNGVAGSHGKGEFNFL